MLYLIRICLQWEQHQRMSATMLLMLMHSLTNPGFLALMPILIFFSRCRSYRSYSKCGKFLLISLEFYFTDELARQCLILHHSQSHSQSSGQMTWWNHFEVTKVHFLLNVLYKMFQYPSVISVKQLIVSNNVFSLPFRQVILKLCSPS